MNNKLNYIDFTNPDDTYSGLPHAKHMIFKPIAKADISEIEKLNVKLEYDVAGIDYIQPPRINKEHYQKVLEAKMQIRLSKAKIGIEQMEAKLRREIAYKIAKTMAYTSFKIK
jgi:hypothetical protein